MSGCRIAAFSTTGPFVCRLLRSWNSGSRMHTVFSAGNIVRQDGEIARMKTFCSRRRHDAQRGIRQGPNDQVTP